jgi:hypothetical protein
MKSIILVLLLSGCAQKYKTYHAIKKSHFNFHEQHNPVTPRMMQGKKETQETCEGQFFFNRNAQKIAEGNIPAMVQYSCPGQEYLMNAKFTETWWTTIIYSRACIKLESYCPMKMKK